MSVDSQAQLLAQNQRLERLENRICRVEQALQTLVEAESWAVKHVWWIVAGVACVGIIALAWVTLH